MLMATDDELVTGTSLDDHRLAELREHVLWLRHIATATPPEYPRRVHQGELTAWSDAVRDLYGEVLRLRVQAG